MSSALHKRAGAAFVLGALALGAVGCGGNTSDAGSGRIGASSSASTVTKGASGESGGPALSRTQLISQADTICRHLNDDIIKSKAISTHEILRVVPRNVSLERTALRGLGELVPPASVASDWHRIVGYRRTLVDELAALLRSTQRHDTKTVGALEESKHRLHAALREVATRAGFKDCAELG